VVTVLLGNEMLRRSSLTARGLAWSDRHPAAFAVLLFLCSLHITTDFASIRELLRTFLSGHTEKLVLATLRFS
jgi:hypothetical protein